jgi:hypothetical protein
MVVDAGNGPPYQVIWIELPIFVSVGPVPFAVAVGYGLRSHDNFHDRLSDDPDFS